MRPIKLIIEKHSNGYVAYPIGLHGILIGQGDTYEEALADVKSAVLRYIETFGAEVSERQSTILEAFIAEIVISV